MKIKVCGLTSIEQMQQLQGMGVHYAGMIFYEPSKRYAGTKLRSRKQEVRDLPIKKVGVFVNTELSVILQAIDDYGLYAVQLHGDETDEFCMDLMDKVKVIKVFRIADQSNIDELVTPFLDACHYFLFDTDSASYGGSGQHFDWSFLEDARIGKPFFLSGGIGPDDLEKIRTFRHPFSYAIDINSRFEQEPGVKDLEKVKTFVHQLNGMGQTK